MNHLLENLSKAVKLAKYYRYLGYFYYLKKIWTIQNILE